ncbi:MAG TPA: hypothetical protein VFI83_02135 [Gaiella sp.]|jgi:hypothetical protein|nr:hypothetical protein [Gaiella sp.]
MTDTAVLEIERLVTQLHVGSQLTGRGGTPRDVVGPSGEAPSVRDLVGGHA